MIHTSAKFRNVVSFGAVKPIIEHFGLNAQIHPLELAQSLRIFYPTDDHLANSVRLGLASLTDAATSEEQIRFFQHQRARRSYVKISEYISRVFGPIVVSIADAQWLDIPSREFLDVAARVANWTVIMKIGRENEIQLIRSDHRESRIEEIISAGNISDHADEVIELAFDYINAGDAWTAVEIGNIIQAVEQSPRVWNLLALSHAMLDDTLAAEIYYDRWRAAGGPMDGVRALYGKAMLYARHHPIGLRSLDRSIDLLDEAHSIMDDLSSVDRALETVIFDEVFNRNGAALIKFRRGEVTDAVTLLKWGIAKLSQTGEKVAIHRSVLIYNLAQCYKQIGDFDLAISTYRELLEVDPYMPEYQLEAAKCFARVRDYSEARECCASAVAIDDTLAAAWSLQGVYEVELEMFDSAVVSHGRAAALDPDSTSHLTNIVYSLVLAERYEEAMIHFTEEWVRASLSLSDAERRASLAAEIYIRLEKPIDALENIDRALVFFPDSAVLWQNRDAVVNIVR